MLKYRSVSKGNSNGSRRVILPAEWSRLNGCPDMLSMMVGERILIFSPKHEIVEAAADYLASVGLFSPMDNLRLESPIEEVV